MHQISTDTVTRTECGGVHHTIPTDSVPTDAIPTDAIPTVHAQSGRRGADCSWIGLRAVPIGKTPNQIPKIRGSTTVWKYVVTFPEEGAPHTHWDSLPSPGSASLSYLSASINAVLSMHPTPRLIPISSQFLLFLHVPSVLEMYWSRPLTSTPVILTADCRNSVCRNRICQNSVCLPSVVDCVSWFILSSATGIMITKGTESVKNTLISANISQGDLC